MVQGVSPWALEAAHDRFCEDAGLDEVVLLIKRNPEFPVSKSPVPMLAVRHVAFHDVLFLDSDPGWFGHYAGRYAKGSVREPLFVELFTRACTRWGRE